MPGNPSCVSVRPADATLALQQSFIYAPVPYAFQMITIHHRATSGSLNSHCGLMERNGCFSFPPLSCSGSGSLRCPQAAPPRRWCPGHGAAWGWKAARRRGFQQGKERERPALSLPAFTKTLCSPAGHTVKVNLSPLKRSLA